MTLDVVLQSAGTLLSVTVNVPNAQVTLNGTPKGPAPYSEFLPRGTYSLAVHADGYTDYTATIAVQAQPVNLVVNLQPAMSTFTFVLPQDFRDPDAAANPRSQVRIFVDNRLVNAGTGLENIPIPPGMHSVRVSSGVFSARLDRFMVQPGQSYVIELNMGLDVRPAR